MPKIFTNSKLFILPQENNSIAPRQVGVSCVYKLFRKQCHNISLKLPLLSAVLSNVLSAISKSSEH